MHNIGFKKARHSQCYNVLNSEFTVFIIHQVYFKKISLYFKDHTRLQHQINLIESYINHILI